MPPSIRTLLVGIAALDDRDPVLLPALRLAEQLGARLHVIHAFAMPDSVRDVYLRIGYAGRDPAEMYAEGMQARTEGQVRGLTRRDAVRCEAAEGPADQVLAEAADRLGADLLIVGGTRRHTLSRTILGTTAQRVLHRARVPVLLLREWAERPEPRVLFATDLSEMSARVLRRGVELVESLFPTSRPEIHALYVGWYDHVLPPPLNPMLVEEHARTRLETFLRQGGAKRVGILPRVRVGNPAQEVVAEAENTGADLLVLGTRGHVGVARYFLGSVAESVLRNTQSNVLVIPPPALAG